MYSSLSPDSTYRLVYDWFAGWRWELWCHGVLHDESLWSFETKEDCATDARSFALAAGAVALKAAA